MSDFIIRNFQSIEEAKIPVNGFTIIVGDSSAGKSACFRAIYAATHNRFKIGQVKHGEDHIEVKVRYTEDPSKVMVVRRNQTGSPIIKLGDKVFSKMSRTVPPEIEEFNNFGSLDVGGDGYSLNFHEQFQKPLLLEYSQKKVMEILSASQSIDDLNDVWYALSAKREQNRGAFRTVEALVNENNAKVSMLKYDVEQMRPLVEKMETLYQEVVDTAQQIHALEDLFTDIVRVEDIEKKQSSYQKVESLCSDLGKLHTTIGDYEATLDSIKMKNRVDKITQFNIKIKELASSEEFVLIPQAEALNDLLIKRTSVNKRGKLYTSISTKCIEMSNVDIVSRQLEALVPQISLKEANDKRISELVDIVENHICPVCGSKVEE